MRSNMMQEGILIMPVMLGGVKPVSVHSNSVLEKTTSLWNDSYSPYGQYISEQKESERDSKDKNKK